MTPINPATELTRINAAAIPDITFISAHRNSNNRGLRKIPPPTPVRPDRKPSPAPAVNNTARCGRALIEAGALRAQTNDRHAERSEEHTSELQSRGHLVCRLLLE